jgi:hypothetical protein
MKIVGSKRREHSPPMSPGKLLLATGLVLAAVGALWWLGERVGLGRLPGDVVIRGERTTFFFPIVTCLLLSVLFSAVLWLIQWFRR